MYKTNGFGPGAARIPRPPFAGNNPFVERAVGCGRHDTRVLMKTTEPRDAAPTLHIIIIIIITSIRIYIGRSESSPFMPDINVRVTNTAGTLQSRILSLLLLLLYVAPVKLYSLVSAAK